MIKLNYQLVRDEGDEIKTFVPKDFPTSFNNLVYLKGPNGRGKSFILHVIAIALYGNHLSDDEIDPGIKRKLNNLLDLEKNKLTFDLEISHPTEDLRIISRKINQNTKDIEVFVVRNGKEVPYPKEKFIREFRLLYTIPNNPTQQLPQLLSEIRVSQTELGSRILQFRNYLEGRIRSIEKSRDAETLQKAKDERDQTAARKRKVEDDIWKLRNDHEKYEKFFYLRIFLDCASEISGIQNQINTLDNELKELDKKVVRKSKEVLKSGRKLDQIMKTIESEKSNIMPILAKYCFSDLKDRYSIINSASVLIEIKKPDLQKTIRENLAAFAKSIDTLARSEETVHSNDLASIDLYSSLRNILRNPKYIGLPVPGTNGDVNFLLGHIDSAIAKIAVIQNKIDVYYSDLKKVKSLINKLNEAIDLYRDNKLTGFSIERSSDEIRLEELEQKKTDLKNKVNLLVEKRANSRKKMVELGMDPTFAASLEIQYKADNDIVNFSELPESQQAEKINSLNQNVKSADYQLNQLKIMFQSQSKKIDELENQEVDPDRIYLSQLKNLNRALVPMESLFRVSLPSSLNRIEKKKIESELDKEYSELIGNYYAKNMQTVLYVDEEYRVKKVDIVNESIITTSGKDISFEYLSTGQSQSSYLTTRLGMTDSKKTIALFDEVAMMDNTSLKPVLDTLRANFQQGKLLGSIIVQRDEAPSIEEM